MAKTAFIAGVITVLLLLSAFRSTAEIKTLTITSDTRPMILLENFRFTHTGHVSISVSSVSVFSPPSSSSQPDPSGFGFFLLSNESLFKVLNEIQQHPNFCILDSLYVIKLLTFRSLSPPPSASANHTTAVKIPKDYNLFFANCVPETRVSMSLRTELYNLDNSTTRNYLSTGQTFLPTLLFLFSIIYFSFLSLWLYIRYSNKLSLHRIHILMAALLLAKALKLLCFAEEKHYIKVTGTPHGWDVFYFIFGFLNVVLLFTIIILVGTRWNFLYPVVRERGKKMLFLIIPLQVLAYAAYVVVHNTGPYTRNWIIWNQVLLLLDFISCFAVVLVFVWNVWSLRKIGTGEYVGLNLDKVRLIKRFYFVVGGYFFFTGFVVSVLRTVYFVEKQWVNNVIEETIILVFYIVMFCVFWLAEKDEFSVITEEEEDQAQILVK